MVGQIAVARSPQNASQQEVLEARSDPARA